jgi:hypothetical protein
MTTRSRDGRETWRRLLEWDKDSGAAERLAGQVLRFEGFREIDPSHPLGGRDGLKDVVCERAGKQWIGAVYFPRGQQSIKDITDKLAADAAGVAANDAFGIAFVTNQELRLAERATLAEACAPAALELYHLERIASILDSPQSYGVRLEFLDIDMTKEEQLAFIAARDVVIADMHETVKTLWAHVSSSDANKEKRAKGMPWVYPQDLGRTFAFSTLSGPRPHECKNCHLVFMVDDSFTPMASLYGSMVVVTCPGCGRTERLSR